MNNPIDKAQQRIDELQQKLRQARALKSRIEARQRSAEAKQKRTVETRRKILAGALALEMMDRDDGVKARFMARLDRFLTRADDRALFGLPLRVQEPATRVHSGSTSQLLADRNWTEGDARAQATATLTDEGRVRR